MQIVAATSDTPFEQPPATSVKISDKYYYEPGTGRQFRSLLAMKRYLTGEEDILPRKKHCNCLVFLQPRQNSGAFKRVAYDGKVSRSDELGEAHRRNLDGIIPTTLQPKGSFLIADGWIVLEIPWKCGLRINRYFIEPLTGQKFRSLPEVQRYISGEKCRSRALAFSNHATAPRSPAPRKKKAAIKVLKDAILDLTNPPEKVGWVFSGDKRDNWSSLLEECVLPNYVTRTMVRNFLAGYEWMEATSSSVDNEWQRDIRCLNSLSISTTCEVSPQCSAINCGLIVVQC